MGYIKKFKLVLVYIGYGTEPLAPKEIPADSLKFDDALAGSYELAPFIGGYNSIFRWIYSEHGLSIELDSALNVIDFGLRNQFDSTTHQLPLGWYLSDTSKSMIRNEIKYRKSNPTLAYSFDQFRSLVLNPRAPFKK